MSRPAPLPLPDHPRCFAVASIVIGRDLAWRDRKASRRWRKLRVLERQLADLRRESPELPTLTDLSGVKLETTITDEQARTLAVDLAFSDPYAPYELGYSERDFVKSFHQSATDVLLSDRLVDRVLTIKEEAMKAHAGFFSSRLKLALAGISSAAVLPFIPAFLGAAVGVAVTSQSIALLHAGSLAASSAQLAGGGWLVEGIRTAASSSARAGARKLVNAAPAAAIRVEVAKWQTWTALRMQEGGCPRDEITAQLEKLAGLEKDIDKELAEERMLNDPHAHRLRELEAKADAVATGRRWVAERCGAS